MNKKIRTKKQFYPKIAVIMIAVLLVMTALPAFSEMTASAAEKTKNTVQLRIGGKKMTKKTYQMMQGAKKKLKVTGQKIKSVQFRSSKKSVASVNKAGGILAKKAGTAKITAAVRMGTSGSKQRKKTVWMKVRVVKPKKPNNTQVPTATDRPANMVVPTDTPSLDSGKILIAYFTRSGNAETLADRIQEKTRGTKFRIETVKTYPQDYSGVYDEAMKEQQENARPELKTRVDNMAEYDTVFVGYPIWHGDTPMTVLTFLESYDFTGKKVIPFCSSGSSRPETSFSSVRASAAGAEILDGFWTRGADVANAADEINQWIDGLGTGDVTVTITLAS
ncbi:MAG: hypothetical protein HFH72_09945 [Lachnospiraceae bacterium]|nr:hypothetical protein [Lachnospiraceae bacterium]